MSIYGYVRVSTIDQNEDTFYRKLRHYRLAESCQKGNTNTATI